jgi:hypothetical protein
VRLVSGQRPSKVSGNKALPVDKDSRLAGGVMRERNMTAATDGSGGRPTCFSVARPFNRFGKVRELVHPAVER